MTTRIQCQLSQRLSSEHTRFSLHSSRKTTNFAKPCKTVHMGPRESFLTKSCQFRDLVPLKYKHQSSSTFFATVPRPINPTWILEVLPKCTLNIIIVSIIGNLNGLKTFLLSKDSLVKPYCLSISMRYYYKLIIFVDALKCRLFLTIFLGVGGGGIS